MKLAALIAFIPALAIAEIPQGPPNADFQPAFAGQTRAAALPQTDVEVAIFARGLELPWGIAALPGGQFLVTERGGTLRLLDADGAILGAIQGVPTVAAAGQGGLLDVAVSPDFARDRLVFWTYAKPVSGGAVTAAARGILRPDGVLDDVRDVFVQSPVASGGRHFGSRIIPQADGTLWITTGDRGAGDRGRLVQDPATTHGKVIRVNWDGSIPDDNPMAGSPVWSLGHRNMQGAALGPGGLWTVEHGPRGGDELNRPQAGRNYGWPLVSYGINYRGSPVGTGKAVAAEFAAPVYYWDPVIAPGGMAFYDGPFGAWRGDLLIGSLNPGALVRLKLEGGRIIGEERLLTDAGRVRDVEVLADGSVLVLLDAGEILRVTPRGM